MGLLRALLPPLLLPGPSLGCQLRGAVANTMVSLLDEGSCMAVLLQPMDRDHLYVVEPSCRSLLNALSVVGFASHTPLHRPSTSSTPSSALIIASAPPSTPEDPHLTHSLCWIAAGISSPSQNLFSVRRFTTNNFCSMEFDHFGLSVKDLATRTLLARCDSSVLYTLQLPASSTARSSPLALTTTTSSIT